MRTEMLGPELEDVELGSNDQCRDGSRAQRSNGMNVESKITFALPGLPHAVSGDAQRGVHASGVGGWVPVGADGEHAAKAGPNTAKLRRPTNAMNFGWPAELPQAADTSHGFSVAHCTTATCHCSSNAASRGRGTLGIAGATVFSYVHERLHARSLCLPVLNITLIQASDW